MTSLSSSTKSSSASLGLLPTQDGAHFLLEERNDARRDLVGTAEGCHVAVRGFLHFLRLGLAQLLHTLIPIRLGLSHVPTHPVEDLWLDRLETGGVMDCIEQVVDVAQTTDE